MSKPHIGYACAECGAEAFVDDRHIVVPHAAGCPVALRLAVLRTNALLARADALTGAV